MNYTLLKKSYWYVTDIQNYYDISLNRATQVKKLVEQHFGNIAVDTDKERGAVSADKVIEYMGGKSRLDELNILIAFKNIGDFQ